MQRPQASVVVPSYNHGRFLDACLDSALSADADLEVVVVDDGSTDGSRERLAARRHDRRLRICEQDNRGAHAALNRGLELARGEVVFLLNSDDLFEPGRIPRFLERFERRPEVAVLTSWLRVIDADGGELGVKRAWHNMPPWPKPGRGRGLADTGDPMLALLEANWVATTSNVALRRELLSRHGLRFAPLRYTHDWDFLLAAGVHGGLEVVEEPLVRYRVHPQNTLGEGRDAGKGRMRFEILWTVARHAQQVCRAAAARTPPVPGPAELRRRCRSSLPRFGCDDLLLELLALRGDGDAPPPSYDGLLDERHPFRARALQILADAP